MTTTAPAAEPVTQLAQGIVCGPWALAFHFDWARQIIDQFELTPIPRAPHWMLGAASINGVIIPVIDLHSFLDPAQATTGTLQNPRLLVGGQYAENAQAALGIVFSGSPIQLSYWPAPLNATAELPSRLRDICRGSTQDERGHTFLDIDPQLLTDMMGAELAVL